MVVQLDLLGTSNIGLYILALDTHCFVPPDIPDSKKMIIENELSVPVSSLTIASSVLLSVMMVGNKNGIVIPYTIRDDEYEKLRSLTDHINISILKCRCTALGNLLLANDRGCIADPRLSPSEFTIIRDVLDVELNTGTIGERSYVGSLGVATTKGVVTSPWISDTEKALIEDTLKIKVEVSTVNGGDTITKCGISANSNGALLGSKTLGHELATILNTLHL